MALWLCLTRGGLSEGTVASLTTSVWEKAAPRSHPDAGKFSSSLYIPSTFQSAAPMLEPRANESAEVFLWALSEELPGTPEVSFYHNLNSCCFLQMEFMRLNFLTLETWAGRPGVGLGPLVPEISLPIFIHHTWVWDQPILCLYPLLPVLM